MVFIPFNLNKENDMKKFIFYIITFISFISTSFASDNIVSNYINNGVKYFSKGHSKSYDLNIEIKYPSNWMAKEGLRPHIVQKFISENGDGSSNCILIVQELPESYSYNDWLEMSKDINGLKETFFADINVNNIKITPTHYSGVPGDLIEYNTKMSQAGLTMFMNTVQHMFFYQNKMIALQCFTGGTTHQISQQNMNILYPLFRAMGNDIILHNKYTDIEKIEKTETTTREGRNDRNEIDNSFLLTSLLISIIFTWGLGLLIPLIIRFGYKKKLSKGMALLVVSAVWLCQFTIAEILADGQGNHRHTALALVALIGYNIIVKKDDMEDKK